MKIKFTLIGTLLFAAVSFAYSQPQGGRPIMVQSPVVNADNTVTFNLLAPNAKEVKVDVQFAGRKEMTKGENGVWTVTLGGAAPDMYPYSFQVDGVSIMDPQNPDWFPNEKFKNSLVDIRGDKPLVHSLQNVPHGSVNYDTYYSPSTGIYQQVVIYTPPLYDKNPTKKYPVFYLISGTTDTEETYFTVGRTNFILDNLIAANKAKEMIVVMPYGNPTYLLSADMQKQLGMKDFFSEMLINELMPYVEKNYRTINHRDYRGIGGFSRGGAQALANGIGRLDLFSNICSYSSFLHGYSSDMYKKVFDNAAKTNKDIHLFWLGVGKDDFLYDDANDFMQFLNKKGIKTVQEQTVGKFGHTWMNAKYFLDRSFRLMFQNN